MTITKNPFWRRILSATLLFGAGTVSSSTIALSIALAPLQDQPADPVAYLMAHPWPGLAVGMLAEALVGFLLYRRLVRKHEHRAPLELDGPRIARELFAGITIGAGFISLVMAVLWALGAYHPTGFQWTNGFFLGAALGLGGAFLEEPVFRGFLLRALDARWGAVIAVIIVSVVFGGIHVVNTLATDTVSLFGAVAIMVESGLFFSAAYYATRRLWLAIGIHFAWNTTLFGIFGMATSGIASMGGLIKGTVSGPDIITGGTFGPEASIVTIVIGAILGSLILLYAIKKHGRPLRLDTEK